MAVPRVNEVLGKAVTTDPVVVPRYNLVSTTGEVLVENVELILKNPVLKKGTLVNKRTLDECLAASGTTYGSGTAYSLVQDNFALFDGATVRIKLHVDSGATPTLNVNGQGAKPLMQTARRPLKSGTPAGTWLTFTYSSTLDFFVQQGSNDCAGNNIGNGVQQTSTYERFTRGRTNTHYWR